jgi:hypothetical protein
MGPDRKAESNDRIRTVHGQVRTRSDEDRDRSSPLNRGNREKN